MIPQDIKKDFPIFKNRPEMVYLDSAATTLKPASVIAKGVEYYDRYGANIARGLYAISEQATEEYEKTRVVVADFINAAKEEVVFTRGTTEAINLLSYSLENRLNEGDEILVTVAEHHSNFLPWQALTARTKARLVILDIDEEGRFKTDDLETLVTPHTKIFAFGFVSNVLGTINPVADIIAQAKQLNPDILTVVDAAQAAAHLPIDIRAIDCDFLAFSSHKMFGPTGVGVLYGKHSLLEAMPPFQYGGEMVLEAGREHSTFKDSPYKFEAGTPDIAGVIAFRSAIEYINSLGLENIREHELAILKYAVEKLIENFGESITIFGPQETTHRSGVIAFSIAGIHPHDIAQMLAEDDICIRAGQHCTAPLHDSLQLPATARLSVSVYTAREDIDRLITKLRDIVKLFGK